MAKAYRIIIGLIMGGVWYDIDIVTARTFSQLWHHWTDCYMIVKKCLLISRPAFFSIFQEILTGNPWIVLAELSWARGYHITKAAFSWITAGKRFPIAELVQIGI